MAKRKVSLKAIEGAIRSPRTPIHLRKGLIKKYGDVLGLSASGLGLSKHKRVNPKEEKIKKKRQRVKTSILDKSHPYHRKKKSTRRTGRLFSNAPVEIYDKVLKIEAQKGSKSKYPGEKFYHNFKGKTKAKIFGLADGSLLIKGAKRLWDSIPQ